MNVRENKGFYYQIPFPDTKYVLCVLGLNDAKPDAHVNNDKPLSRRHDTHF